MSSEACDLAMPVMLIPSKNKTKNSKTKLGRIVAGIMGGSLVVALALMGVSTSSSSSVASVPVTSRHLLHAGTHAGMHTREGVSRMGFYDNLDSLDPAAAYKCMAVMKHMHGILPPKSVDCAIIADAARDAAADAADEWKRRTADDIAEAAGAAALAVATAADAAALAVEVAAAAAASGPDAPQTAAIAAAAANMIAETAAKAADVAAAVAAKHAINVRAIARALMNKASAAADATPATLIGAASEAGPYATEDETDKVALRSAIARRTVEDAVSFAMAATDVVDAAVRAHTDAANAWRQEVVEQGNDARQGATDVANIATTGISTAMVATQAALNVKKVAAAVAVAAQALAEVAPAVAAETAAFAKLTTARAVARGTTGLCTKVPDDFTYGDDGAPEPTDICDASALGPAYASPGDCHVDGIEHIQARPIEAALVTFGTSLFAGQWRTHATMGMLKQGFRVLNKIASQRFDSGLDELYDIRGDMLKLYFLTNVFFARDVLFGALEMARACATVVNFKLQSAAYIANPVDNPEPDPRIPMGTFLAVQKAVTDLADLFQEFVSLVGDAMLDLLDSLTKCLMLLLQGVLNGNANAIKEFFVVFINAFGKIISQLVISMAQLLLHEDSPFHVICDIVDLVRKGFCTILTEKWIPTGLDIHCGGKTDKECSWWPFNGDEDFEKDVIYGTPGDNKKYSGDEQADSDFRSGQHGSRA